MVIKFINGKIKVIHQELPNSHAHYEVQTNKKRENKTREEKNKLYYEKHKEDYYALPYECECGCIVTKSHLNRHRETAKHKILMDNKSI